MKPEERHMGFKDNIAGDVTWSANSFLNRVYPTEETNIRGIEMVSGLATLAVFFGGMAILAASSDLGEWVPSMSVAAWCWMGGVFVVCGLFLHFLRARLVRQVVMSLMRRRSELLFAPEDETILVGLEDPMTYDKMKLMPEDMGLMRVTPQYIQLELGKHRAQFQTRKLGTVTYYNECHVPENR